MTTDPNPSREEQINEIIAAYLEAERTGQAPAPEEVLARHADLADDLRSFFADRELFLRAARPAEPPEGKDDRATGVRPEEVPTLTHNTSAPAVGVSIRYFGDYELVEEVARGGMGIVFKARQVSVNRTVALKMILAGQVASTEEVERFRREAEASANLDHPNIVPIYEVGEHEGQHYFSMKYVSGGNLSEHIRTNQGKDPRASVALLAKVARAVHHAHQRGILHRDLKPGNVLIDEAGEPLVTDFGLAKRVQGDVNLTQTGAIVGTPSYMAPEQAAGKRDLSVAVDVYSLGAILYEMLTGNPPFRAETPLEVLLQVLEKDPESPRKSSPHVSRDLETICMKCLEKDHGRRYTSAEALADDLDRCLAGEPIQARPASPLERTLKWVKRRPAIAALIAALVVALVSGTVISTVFAINAQTQKKHALDQRQQAEGQKQIALELAEAEKHARDRAEQSLYVQQIALAQQAWQDSNVERARNQLEAAPQRLRDWEWRFLRNLLGQALLTVPLESGGKVLAFLPDGERFITETQGSRLSILDSGTGEVVTNLGAFAGIMEAVAVSPDGKWIASGTSWVLPQKHMDPQNFTLDAKKLQDLTTHFSEMMNQEKNGELKLWDAAGGKEPARLMGEMSPPRDLAFSPDGRLLAVACQDTTVRVFGVPEGKQIAALDKHTGEVWGVAFRPDGKHLASVGGELRIWDTATWQEAFTPQAPPKGGFAVAYSPDGNYLAVAAHGNQIHLLDPNEGWRYYVLSGHTEAIQTVAFSPDSRHLASGSDDGTIRLWDILTGAETLRLRGHRGQVNALAFHPDGLRLASVAGTFQGLVFAGEVKLWDVAQRDQQAVTFPGGGEAIGRLVQSPGGKLLAGIDTEKSTIHVWETYAGRQLTSRTHAGLVTGLAFHPTQPLVASAGSDSGASAILEFDADTPGISFFDFTGVWMARRHREGKASGAEYTLFRTLTGWMADQLEKDLLAGKSSEVRLWNPLDGKDLHALEESDAPVNHLAFNPDGTRLAAGCADKLVRVWDTATGKLLYRFPAGGLPVQHVAFSPDGRRLACGSGYIMQAIRGDPTVRGRVKVWNLEDGHEVVDVPHASVLVTCVAFSPDGVRLTAAGGPQFDPLPDLEPIAADSMSLLEYPIKVWDAETGKELYTLPGHRGRVRELAFSSDGRYLASAGGADRTARLWDVKAGKEVHVLRGHTHCVRSVAFSPNGKRLFSASGEMADWFEQGEVKLWEVESGQELLSLDGSGSVVLSPDGNQLFASTGRTVKAWNAHALTEQAQGQYRNHWRANHHEWRKAVEAECEADNQWQAALLHLDRLIEAEPMNADFHARRGMAHNNLGNNEKALADFSRALELNGPDWVLSWRGFAHSNLGQTEKALADFTRAIADKKAEDWVWLNRGHAHVSQRRWEDAIADYTEAIRLSPSDAYAFSGRGACHVALNDWANAEADFRKALELDPGNYVTWSNLTIAHLGPRDLAEYRKTCSTMMKKFSATDDPEAAGTIAWCCLIAANDLDPVEVLSMALFAHAKSADPRKWLGTVGAALYRIGSYDRALVYLLDSTKHDEGSFLAGTNLLLAMTYHQFGRAAEAKEALARAVEWMDDAERNLELQWHERVELQTLQKEASKLVKP